MDKSFNTPELFQQERLHPAYDRETKVAVFNKFLTDVADQELPKGFNEENGKVIFVLDDYEMSLSDGKNHCKFNKEGKLEMFYHLPESGLIGFKDELLANEIYWGHKDIDYLMSEGVISSEVSSKIDFSEYHQRRFHWDGAADERFVSAASKLNDAMSKISNLESFRKEIKTSSPLYNWRFENNNSYIACTSQLSKCSFEYGTIEGGEYQVKNYIDAGHAFLLAENYEREKEALIGFVEQFEKDCEFDLVSQREIIEATKLENYKQVEGYLAELIEDLPIEKVHEIDVEFNRDDLYNYFFDNYMGGGRRDLNQIAEALKEYGLDDNLIAKVSEDFDHGSGCDEFGWYSSEQDEELQELDGEYVEVIQLEKDTTHAIRKSTNEMEL